MIVVTSLINKLFSTNLSNSLPKIIEHKYLNSAIYIYL